VNEDGGPAHSPFQISPDAIEENKFSSIYQQEALF